MKVRLATNIGHADARRLGLQATFEGSVLDVTQGVAETLLQRGWAVEAKGKVRGVPAADLKAVPE